MAAKGLNMNPNEILMPGEELSLEDVKTNTKSPNLTPTNRSPRKGGGGGGGSGGGGGGGGGGGAFQKRRRSLSKQKSLQKASCLCSPTTHAGSFRCRHHRSPLPSSSSVGSGLAELADKVEFTFDLPKSCKNPCMTIN